MLRSGCAFQHVQLGPNIPEHKAEARLRAQRLLEVLAGLGSVAGENRRLREMGPDFRAQRPADHQQVRFLPVLGKIERAQQKRPGPRVAAPEKFGRVHHVGAGQHEKLGIVPRQGMGFFHEGFGPRAVIDHLERAHRGQFAVDGRHPQQSLSAG